MDNIGPTKFSILPKNAIFFKSDMLNSYFIPEDLYNTLLTNGLLPPINRSKDSEDEMNKHELDLARLERNIINSDHLAVEKVFTGVMDQYKVAFESDAEAFIRKQKLLRVSDYS